MSFARNKGLGLGTRLALWTSVVLAASFAAGFVWVHYGLKAILQARNDAFLERKAAELLAGADSSAVDVSQELEAEIDREVMAYEADGLVVVLESPVRALVRPRTEAAAALMKSGVDAEKPMDLALGGDSGVYRVLGVRSRFRGTRLILGISLRETWATLAAFDRRVAGGSLAFLAIAAAGGFFLARQALRPVAESVRTARRLDPEQLSERLPRTGSGDELDELAGTINDLLDRLAAYHRQVIRFTADASHELRGPLAAMRAAVDVALRKPRESEDYRNTLASLGEQCDRLTALVSGLLLLARVDAGEVTIGHEPVDLAALVREIAEVFEPLADEGGVRLMVVCPIPVEVLGDPSRLRQLATNLLDNAIRFASPSGSVRLAVDRTDEGAVLEVADDGAGIAPEHLPRVFDRFYQVDPARASGGGGLGLCICQWIVRAHGGVIEAASDPGQGTVFRVLLPWRHREPPGPTRAGSAPGVVAGGGGVATAKSLGKGDLPRSLSGV